MAAADGMLPAWDGLQVMQCSCAMPAPHNVELRRQRHPLCPAVRPTCVHVTVFGRRATMAVIELHVPSA